MFTVQAYNNFFRYMAELHVNILHDTNAESQDGDPGKRRFFLGVDDAINNTRQLPSEDDHCIMVLLEYQAQGYENGSYDYRSRYTGGFMILAPANVDDIQNVESARVITEETAWDCINYIIQGMVDEEGMHCNSPFGDVSLNDFKLTASGPVLEKRFGWIVEFDFLIERRQLINKARITSQFPT